MKRKQFIILFLALMLSGPSLQASTQTFEENATITNPPASNAMFDVNTSTSNVTDEIRIVADEVDSLLNDPEPAQAPAETPKKLVEHTVKAGDSLWKIAQELLGDGNRYREIVEANKDKYPSLLKNPDLIHAGWNLKVPVNAPEATTPQAPTTNAATDNTGTTGNGGNVVTGGHPAGTPVVTMGGTVSTASGNVVKVPQLSVQERVNKLQSAMDAANRALLAQKKRIADLNPQTVRFLIDNKFMTEEEWMSMNPPAGYIYRLDRLGKVQLVGNDNKPLTNAEMAKLDQKAPANNKATAPDNKETKALTDKELAAADTKAKQEAYNRQVAAEKAKKEKLAAEKAAAEKAAAGKTATDKAAAEKLAAEKAAAEKAATEKAAADKVAAEKAEKEAAEKAASKYQQIIKGMGMPDLADNSRGYYDAIRKGAQVIHRGIFKSNSFDKFMNPMDYPESDIYQLQRDLRNSQQQYEKMVDKNKTSRVLGIFGDTIESAGKRVEESKQRLAKAWTELKKSLDEAKSKAAELTTEVAGNKAKIEAANKELAKLDKYDAANASQVQSLNKEIKELNDGIADSQKKLDAYQTLKSTFKM